MPTALIRPEEISDQIYEWIHTQLGRIRPDELGKSYNRNLF